MSKTRRNIPVRKSTALRERQRIDMDLKKAEIQERIAMANVSEQRIVIEKLNLLVNMLESAVVDQARSMPGSDTMYKPLFEEEGEVFKIKGKIFKLLDLL